MKKFLFCVSLVFSLLVLTGKNVLAYDPLSEPNNRFGIHILNEDDLEDAASLVNASGGEWGYVTLVIPQDDRNVDKWQKIFDRMRKLKLIPIVRLATTPLGNTWKKPDISDIPNWVSFLNSLNWVIKNRYVVLFNEPNHDKEWGGKASASEFVDIVNAFSEELKASNADYFILPAGMDLAAGNTKDTIDAAVFFKQMYEKDSLIFGKYDGLASHSYPNPDFSGKVTDSGRSSIKGFLWEIERLTPLGLKPRIPVFITETGWKVNDKNSEEVATNFKTAIEKVWNNPQVVAVTPFVLSYTNPPFDIFSWRDPKQKEKTFRPQYSSVVQLAKNKGEPIQIHNYKFLESPLPPQLISDSTYTISPPLTNTGQSIWQAGDITTKVTTNLLDGAISVGNIDGLAPYEKTYLPIKITTPSQLKRFDVSIEFFYKGKPMGEKLVRQIEIIPPTELRLVTNLGWKKVSNATDLDFLIYEGDTLVKKIADLDIKEGEVQIPAVHDVIPGRTYRFVLVLSGYLPKQTVGFLNSSGPSVMEFGRMYPFDFNSDGKFSLSDIPVAFLHPIDSIKLLNPFK